MNGLKATLLTLLLTPATGAEAQQFVSYGTQDGLPSVIVESIAQDDAGFIWAGTQGGLVRFDGRDFSVFKASPVREGFLRDEYVHEILVHAGRLYVGTNQGGLHALDPTTNRIDRFSIPDHPGGNDVRSLATTSDGWLLVGTYGAGLFRANTDDRSLSPLGRSPTDRDARISRIVPSRAFNGIVWLLTSDGLAAFDLASGDYLPIVVPGVIRSPITALAEPSGRVLIATQTGLFLLRASMTDAGFDLKLLADDSGSGQLADPFIRELLVVESTDEATDVYLGTETAGVQRIRLALDRFDIVEPASGVAEGLENNRIRDLFLDRQGLLWVGTWGGGLGKARPKPRFSHIRPSGNARLSPPTATIMNIAASDRRRVVWLATLGSGLVRWDRETGRFDSFFSQPEHPLQSLSTIYEDAEGVLWTGRLGDALHELDPDDPESIRASHPLPTGADPGWLRLAFESPEYPNTLWIGTQRAGLLRFNSATRQVEGHWSHDVNDATSIPSNEIWDMAATRDGFLWIGTVGGLARFDPRTGLFRTYVHDPFDPETLSSNRIATVVVDTTGILWAGASDNGFNRFDPLTGRVRRIMPENGLPDDEVGNLSIDHGGMLWLATNNGLARLNPYEDQFTYFEPSDGLHGRVFTYRSNSQTRDGEIYLGGPNGGITFFHPDSLSLFVDPPRSVITRMVVDDSVLVSAPIYGQGSEIRGDYRHNDIDIQFAALDFREPAKNRFRVLLEGSSDELPREQSESFVRYPNLAPGDYRFYVWAANSDGYWSSDPATVGITISPPFWKTTWFFLTSLFLIAGVIAGGYSYRIRQIRRVDLERQRIADDLHDDLGGKLSSIALKLELMSRRRMDGAQALKDLSSASRSAVADLRNTIWLVGTGQDDVSSLVARMETVTAESLVGIPYRFEVEGSVPERAMAPEARRQVFLIYREVLHNIVKHSQAREAVIRVHGSRQKLSIIVRDDGVGFDAIQDSVGNGLRTMKKRAASLRAALEVTSKAGSGTEVSIEVSLNRPTR